MDGHYALNVYQDMLEPSACRYCMVALMIAALAIAIESPLDVSQSSADPMAWSHTEKTSKLVLDIGMKLHVDPQ